MTNATSSLHWVPLYQLYICVIRILSHYSRMVKRHLRWWCDGFSQPIIILISCARWGLLRALLRLISCGPSLHFVFYNLFFSKRFYDQLTGGFRIPNLSGFRILYQCRFWIPVSNIQNFLDSRFGILLHGAILKLCPRRRLSMNSRILKCT